MEFEDSSSESDECVEALSSQQNGVPVQHQIQVASPQQPLQQPQQQQQQQQVQPTQFLQIQPQPGILQGAPTLLFHPQQPGTAFVSGIVIKNGSQGFGRNEIAIINAQDLVAIQQQQLLQQQQLARANAASAAVGETTFNREVLPEVEKNRHQSEVKDLNVIQVGTLPEEVSSVFIVIINLKLVTK